MAMGLSEFFDIIANHSLAISAYFVSIAIYMCAGRWGSTDFMIQRKMLTCVLNYLIL